MNLLVEAFVDDASPTNPAQLRTALLERLKDVEERLADLHQERETLRNDLAITEQFLNVWRRATNVQGPIDRLQASLYPIVDNVPMPPRKPKNPPREKVVDAALEIISERGVPVSRSDLYEALQERGIRVYGKDPLMVFSTMLWRSQDRIVRLGNNGYWFKDRPYEALNYLPEVDELLGVAETEPEDGLIEDPDDDTEVTSRED